VFVIPSLVERAAGLRIGKGANLYNPAAAVSPPAAPGERANDFDDVG
jgi:hypothetical protein